MIMRHRNKIDKKTINNKQQDKCIPSRGNEPLNQSINRLFVKATLRIFQLTKAFKVATPDSRDIQEEAGRRPGNGGCRRQGNLYVGKPTQNHHQGTACGSG